MKSVFLSVVIPCFNEERNIRLGALENVAHFLSKKNYPSEILIIDDGSKDESRKLVSLFIKDHPNFVLRKRHHQGKSAAVTSGVSSASGKYILFTDLDQATPLNQ